MRRRPQDDFESAVTLIASGYGDTAIAARTGIPRSTISAWRHGRGVAFHRRLARARDGWRPPSPAAYCYLLGIYLGDGHLIVRPGGTDSLVVSMDARYPGVIAEVEEAISRTLSRVPVNRGSIRGSRVVTVQASHPALPFIFPQHGTGPKHLRSIELAPWQRSLTTRNPEALLRGLIHSDGCRVLNRFQVRLPSGKIGSYEYPRYFFSNLSEGIRRIFCSHCDLLGSPLEPVERKKHLRFAPGQRRSAGPLHRAEALSAALAPASQCGRRDSNPHSLSTTRT
jgi:hypothetical protein